MEPKNQRLVTEATLEAKVSEAVPPAVETAVQPLVTQAIVDSVIEVYDPLAPILTNDELAFAVVDEDGRRTWLEAGADGGPTAHAASKLAPAVSPAVETAIGIQEQNTPVTDLSFAVVDEDGRRTWLEADQEGRPSDRALGLIGDGLALSARPEARVVCSGDSMTGGASGTPYPTHLANLTGWTVINDGVGGENTTTIAGRMGGRPMLVAPAGGTIPASGPVNVTLSSDDKVDSRGVAPLYQQLSGVNPVQIAGVEGTLALVNKDDPATRYYTFTRATAGEAVKVNYPAPMITLSMREHRTGVHVMWWGTNDTSQTGNDATHIIARQQALIEHLAEDKPRYLVIGLTISDAAWRAPMNAQFLKAFGRRFIDLGAYLSHPAAMDDAGLTPTAEDTAAQATGKVPPSLLADPTHLNNTGNILVARRVADRIREMGWLS